MCKPRHGTIEAACRLKLVEQLGTTQIPNKEAYRVLKEHGGCLNHKVGLTLSKE